LKYFYNFKQTHDHWLMLWNFMNSKDRKISWWFFYPDPKMKVLVWQYLNISQSLIIPFISFNKGYHYECPAKLIMADTFIKSWLEIIFCAFFGISGSKVARGVRVQLPPGFEPPTFRSPARYAKTIRPRRPLNQSFFVLLTSFIHFMGFYINITLL